MFLITFGTSKDHVEDLKLAIAEGKRKNCFYGSDFSPDIDDNFISGQVETLPVDAHYAQGEYKALKKVAGRIACHMVVPYPPGIPLVLPGMRISNEVVENISKLLKEKKEAVHGILWRNDEAIIRVLTGEEENALSKKRGELKEKFKILKRLGGLR